SDPTVAGGRRINRAAFTAPPAGKQGTLGRNALNGFPVSQLDFALRREFALKERASLQFRAEFFNLFNHPNFGDPVVSSLTTPLFGQSIQMLNQDLGAFGRGFNALYQMGGPRSVQFALRLSF